jgi:hypothetical protein
MLLYGVSSVAHLDLLSELRSERCPQDLKHGCAGYLLRPCVLEIKWLRNVYKRERFWCRLAISVHKDATALWCQLCSSFHHVARCY